jgi:dynein heavy chain, axonemal
LEEVYIPLLSNPKNMDTWPEVVASDVIKHFQSITGAVHIIAGKAKGKTVLPLPDVGKLKDESDKNAIHFLEQCVIQWSHLIQNVISEKSEKDDPKAGPLAQIEFWDVRTANLKFIQEQLLEEKIAKIGDVLKGRKSSYFNTYQAMVNDINDGTLILPFRLRVKARPTLTSFA